MKEHQLHLTNSLSRTKEKFEPLVEGRVGLYVCGPTVYGHPHLGHARPYITFDVLYRYMTHLGYKVRYVRNITDVGHLENDADSGEDKIAKKARLEQLEPMEIVELYTQKFHEAMRLLNNLPVNIEPRASGHIIEQIEMIKSIIANGWAYESNGSVYFDVISYAKKYDYGKLSGRVIDELIAGAGNERRELEGQEEKKNPADFALWKKASPEHIMRWPSPWGDGFPGWHIECSAMSTKYLGETFDIHGGGIDLVFPHHENEIAQSCCAFGTPRMANIWMHNGFLQVEGQKMSKSLGNFVTINELLATDKFGGRSWPGEVLRLAMLKTHYRQPIDFTVKALEEAEKTLATWAELAGRHKVSLTSGLIEPALLDALQDDLNTAAAFAVLADLARKARTNFNDAQQLAFCADFLGFNTKAWFSRAEITSAKADFDPVLKEKVDTLITARLEALWPEARAVLLVVEIEVRPLRRAGAAHGVQLPVQRSSSFHRLHVHDDGDGLALAARRDDVAAGGHIHEAPGAGIRRGDEQAGFEGK